MKVESKYIKNTYMLFLNKSNIINVASRSAITHNRSITICKIHCRKCGKRKLIVKVSNFSVLKDLHDQSIIQGCSASGVMNKPILQER